MERHEWKALGVSGSDVRLFVERVDGLTSWDRSDTLGPRSVTKHDLAMELLRLAALVRELETDRMTLAKHITRHPLSSEGPPPLVAEALAARIATREGS